VHASLLAQNNTRVWVWSAKGGAGDPASVLGVPDQVTGTGLSFYQQYRSNGGHNGHFDFPAGDNGWGSWAGQLGAMSGDIVGAIR
jgi:S-formylglutathione hydrolase FrmB